MSVPRKVSPRKATLLTGLVLASTVIGGPALAATHVAPRPTPIHVAAVTPATTVVSRLSLATGPSTGGQKILVTGTKLATVGGSVSSPTYTAKTVKFGTSTVTSSSVSALSESALEVTVPAAGSTPKVAVTVGDATKGPSYTYVAADITVSTVQSYLTGLAPTSEAGLAGVTLSGANFDPAATKVVVGGTAVKATVTASSIAFALPAGLVGVQDVVVTDPRNSVYVGHVAYTASVTPTLSAVSSYATVEAATPVTLTGTHLDAVASATYGTSAEKVTVAKTKDATKLVVTIPKGTAGTGTLTVATKYGNTATLSVERKAAPTPTVTAVTGAVNKGGVVTLTGTGLVGLKTVTVTNSAGKAFKGSSITEVTGTSAKVKLPALVDGTYGLVVTTPATAASSSYSLVLGTPVASAPTVSAASASGDGTAVTLTGTGLGSLTKVTLTKSGGSPVEQTTGIVPNGAGTSAVVTLTSGLTSGTYGVTATSAAGTSTSQSFTYTAAAPAPTVSAAVYTADAGDGTSLALTGTHLGNDTQVRYYADGDDPATESVVLDFTDTDATSGTAALDADLLAGDYHVQVSADGTTWSTAADFTVS